MSRAKSPKEGSLGKSPKKRDTGMFTLYSMQRSGNCYKVRLALAQLAVDYHLVEIDILTGETRTPEFLAGGTPLVPEDRLQRGEMLQWMFFEQHSLEPYLGAAHFWLVLIKGGRELQMHAIEEWMEKGYKALRVMEQHLENHRFFAAGRYTIADIALYAFTHVANECGFDLTGFPAVRGWLKRVAEQPGHIRMDWHPAALEIAE